MRAQPEAAPPATPAKPSPARPPAARLGGQQGFHKSGRVARVEPAKPVTGARLQPVDEHIAGVLRRRWARVWVQGSRL